MLEVAEPETEMARPRHPNKEIEAVLEYAEAHGWTVTHSKGGHAWGRMKCRFGQRDGCQRSIFSTPKNPHKHARELRAMVDKCPH